MADVKLETNKLFRTFKTQKEAIDYIEMHIPEEKRLLYMGFFFGLNYAANQVNETFDLKYKDKKWNIAKVLSVMNIKLKTG